MKALHLLSRNEMKMIKGGVSDCEGQCLWCNTPNGFEAWYRPNDSGDDADSQCGNIYPAYGEGNGIYTDCDAGTEHGVVAPVHC